jgi:hypothetical protein
LGQQRALGGVVPAVDLAITTVAMAWRTALQVELAGAIRRWTANLRDAPLSGRVPVAAAAKATKLPPETVATPGR